MSRRLEDLAPEFRTLAEELLSRLGNAGIDVLVVYTRRTPEEQAALIAARRSWTPKSRHLTGHAIDVVPPELAKLPNWAPEDPLWERIGVIGEEMGLRWGGRWRQRDCPHFEMQVEQVEESKSRRV